MWPLFWGWFFFGLLKAWSLSHMQAACDWQMELKLRGLEKKKKAWKKAGTLIPRAQQNRIERSWSKADNSLPPFNELTAKKFSLLSPQDTDICQNKNHTPSVKSDLCYSYHLTWFKFKPTKDWDKEKNGSTLNRTLCLSLASRWRRLFPGADFALYACMCGYMTGNQEPLAEGWTNKYNFAPFRPAWR